ncbi:MAG: HAD-IIB family hydrolase [Desulfobacterales bacterium]|nr:HAD-IIB family hydrolase [Desulfobacterales bacterium]MCP4159243.1 HAD-IIB family hydrolase [Deltaproteobacteria bacterium]
MKNIADLSEIDASNVKCVFFDIDDTITTSGKILPEAYQALWKLKENGIKSIPITGRPAGWCDHIVRMWPVDAIVGENGAFYFRIDENSNFIKRYFFDEKIFKENRLKLNKVSDEILAKVSGTALASDQNYREADLAIDFCEDVDHIGWDKVDDICDIFKEHGAICKVSSIHVNGWFGDYNKLSMTKFLVNELFYEDLNNTESNYIFCGDSPNDEPMFEFFSKSCGVKNVIEFKDKMDHLPSYIADHEGSLGFAQIVNTLLKKRS